MSIFTTNKKTSNLPWKRQRKELIRIFKGARDLYNQGPLQYYEGPTVAGFTDQQRDAFRMGTQRAEQGNANVNNAERFNNQMVNGRIPDGDPNAMRFYRQTMNGVGPDTDPMANRFTSDVLNGQYGGDPYQSQVFKQIENRVMPSVNSTFSAAGRYGSNAHQDAASSALTREFAPVANQMYQQGVDRMQTAAGMRDSVFQNEQARQMAGANNLQQAYDNGMGRQERAADRSFNFGAEDWRNLAQLQAIGQTKQQQNQNVMNDKKNRWDFGQNAAWDNLGRYNAMVQGNYGGSQSYQAPSTFATMLGTALSAVPILGGAYNTFMNPSQGVY